ncbi:MAG: SMC-Scp complex subunit ScpB [Deltaproteobacteria bacterium RIFCSPLOWO2_02_FULL_50_16]|nr:MAG: SMC-Scp complex subunit ScpB [Deltaproteobacteria bacterium RIFCSPHIGHO2_02_FULL_50_15]OGQ56897.1 MAG: SMC-Scp complex subunit ScpB [Deltaproteobacteria bacterium RIFCSPLOWO2_02_FULL_50_16]OGQ67925.1 MAG: SMC-Scp complex subunit ScpB [Deltaproteobacteria bacterium RIFCSPLOWO2_12_FULL_50_11]
MEYLKSLIEALIYISESPLSFMHISNLLISEEGHALWRTEGRECPTNEEIKEALQSLEGDYSNNKRGLCLSEVSGGYQFRTQKQFSSWIQLLNKPLPSRLSTPALETLSIIAYKQPMTRPEIEDIRGVDSGWVLRSLLERRLIRILGKKEEPGNPLIYGTSREFLEIFGLKNLSDLPPLKDFENLIKEEGKAESLANQVPIKDLITSEETLMVIEEQEKKSIENLEEEMKGLRSMDRNISETLSDQKEEEGVEGENRVES